MSNFDPAAETARYLTTVRPEAAQRAIAYTHGGHWLLLWGCLVTLVAAWLILKSGVPTKVRDRFARGDTRPNRAVFAVALVVIALDFVIELPWTIYAAWWRERSYGLSSQPFADWLGQTALSSAISAILISAFLVAVYALLRRAPRTWWLWASGIGIAGMALMLLVSPIMIEPLFNKYTPAPAGPMRDTVVRLAEAAQVPHDKILIYDGSRQSDRYTANVSGLGGSARVAMSDTMFKQNADTSEVVAVLGHEMGHYARLHVVWILLWMAVLLLVGFWLASRLFGSFARWLGLGGAVISDPAGLPVLLAIFATLGLLMTPLSSTLTRLTESDADAFSLRIAHEPDGLAKALVKTIEYRAASPGAVEEAIFYDHPSVERRIRRAMDWKAAHPDAVGAPFGALHGKQ
jgi:STE24 endopeptidase